MAIAPINGISVRQNYNSTVNFTGRRQNEEGDDRQPLRRSTNNMAAVPVVVLMAMTPGMLNGKQPVTVLPANEMNITEVLAQAPEIEEATYVTNAEEFNQINWPYSLASLSNEKIQLSKVFKSNGNYYNLVMTKFKTSDAPRIVNNVYLFKSDSRGNVDKEFFPLYDSYTSTPTVMRLIYHKPESGNEFCGALVSQDLMNKQGNIDGYMQYEVKLPDDIANVLIDLLATDGNSKWDNRSSVGFQKTTSAKIQSPYVVD